MLLTHENSNRATTKQRHYTDLCNTASVVWYFLAGISYASNAGDDLSARRVKLANQNKDVIYTANQVQTQSDVPALSADCLNLSISSDWLVLQKSLQNCFRMLS